MDKSKLENVKIAKIDMKDYPDFVDAFVESASIEGRELSEEELDELNEDRDFVHQLVMEKLY